MHVSLNEIETEVRKAARGCGLAWGQAEEAGKAARWLAAREVDILPILVDVLEAHLGGRWHGPDRPSSPFVAGPAIADHAYLLAGGGRIELGAVARPILLVPFASAAARSSGAAVDIMLPSGRTLVTATGGDRAALAAMLSLQPSGPIDCVRSRETVPTDAARASSAGAEIDPEAWARLARLAHRTYVPASAVSRERGAGAGAIDND
jgi:hypothetical protein